MTTARPQHPPGDPPPYYAAEPTDPPPEVTDADIEAGLRELALRKRRRGAPSGPPAAAAPSQAPSADDKARFKEQLLRQVTQSQGQPEVVRRLVEQAEAEHNVLPTASLFATLINYAHNNGAPKLLEQYLALWKPRSAKAQHYAQVFAALRATGISPEWKGKFWGEFVERLPAWEDVEHMQRALHAARKCGVTDHRGFRAVLRRLTQLAAGDPRLNAEARSLRDQLRRWGVDPDHPDDTGGPAPAAGAAAELPAGGQTAAAHAALAELLRPQQGSPPRAARGAQVPLPPPPSAKQKRQEAAAAASGDAAEHARRLELMQEQARARAAELQRQQLQAQHQQPREELPPPGQPHRMHSQVQSLLARLSSGGPSALDEPRQPPPAPRPSRALVAAACVAGAAMVLASEAERWDPEWEGVYDYHIRPPPPVLPLAPDVSRYFAKLFAGDFQELPDVEAPPLVQFWPSV
eukprot:TRINITY_DN8121_c1_g1_i1.p1 TRINITY_DN8121_c1_g1~~TRINITY_DN8121_c1_g1_i1.p1  ORF type:complete len:464 (+),score=148.90 TRINITY_DN8121_c1_g1_i1:71-1462(+)